MTDLTPIECEARLVGLSKQRRKDGDWIEVKFHIHPDDHPAALFILPLGTDCMLSIKGVPEKADETTTEAPAETGRPKGGERAKRPWHELSMPEQAGIFVNDVAFAKWLLSTEYEGYSSTIVQPNAKWCADADAVLKSRCGIESKTELGTDANGEALNGYARSQFLRIEDEWRASQRGETDADLKTQAMRGP